MIRSTGPLYVLFLVPLRNGSIYSYMGTWVELYRMAKKAI